MLSLWCLVCYQVIAEYNAQQTMGIVSWGLLGFTGLIYNTTSTGVSAHVASHVESRRRQEIEQVAKEHLCPTAFLCCPQHTRRVSIAKVWRISQSARATELLGIILVFEAAPMLLDSLCLIWPLHS